MNNYAAEMMAPYKYKGLLLDTNLLLLYLVGQLEPERILNFKRTKKFTLEDYHKIVRIVSSFEILITTPHILAEVSNLSGQLPAPLDMYFLALLTLSIADFSEHYVPSAEAMNHYLKLGVTDAGIIHLVAERQYFVLTDDFPLANYLQTQAVAALNYEHIRMLPW